MVSSTKTDISGQPAEPPLVAHSVLLLLLDGLAISPAWSQSALNRDNMPFLDSLFQNYPTTLLKINSSQRNTCYLTIGSGQEVASEEVRPSLTLSSYLSSQNKKQLKITETERLAALTNFFNGGREEKNSGEDWQIISSDSSPEEAATTLAFRQTVKAIIKAIKSKNAFDFIGATLPILDLAALNGNFVSVKEAAEILDKNLRLICETAATKSVTVIISSSGGSAENISEDNSEDVLNKFILNPVPFLIVGPEYKGRNLGTVDLLSENLSLSQPSGTLADITPTILTIMGLVKPLEMTGQNLWQET